MWVKKKTVMHERNECIWCGSCALIAPRQRAMSDEDGKACLTDAHRKGKQYMTAQIDEDDVSINQEAAEACPVRIIKISK